MSGVTVSYSGVHQAYQIALAADEARMLDRFYCSIYNGPKFFGGSLGTIVGQKRLASRRVEGLDTSKVEEYPWPLLWHELFGQRDWLKANERFDRHVASRLNRCRSKLFVGIETCAHHSFEIAHRLGMITFLDCPGVDAQFLDDIAKKAAAQFDLRVAESSDTPAMKIRKQQELALADVIIVCSEFQLKTMHLARNSKTPVHVIPLWIDQRFWRPSQRAKQDSRRLKVLFAGKINVRKGIPYLLESAKACASKVELTLVGNLEEDVESLLERDNVRVVSALPKADMLAIYQTHDVFVLPSLGDAFGISALEAMACGLPVIVSDHCGVPVPNPEWRVPILQSDPITDRLMKYAEDRALLGNDSRLAANFAAHYTAQRYRTGVREILDRISGQKSG